MALRAAGLVAGGATGEALLVEAVAELRGADARVEYARAVTDSGVLLRQRERLVEARDVLRQGLDAAHRCGADALAERAETELRAAGARPRRVVLTGVDALTASERRIAELAAQGLTDRQIAQDLFVTARTVEGHLTHAFQKLHVDSRGALAAALVATPQM